MRLAAALLAATLLSACDDVRGTASVIDGDTIRINGTAIRLVGIDAPELRQTCTRDGFVWWCGQSARTSLAHIAEGQPVSCLAVGRDRYGRTLASCSVNGLNLSSYMVRVGMAISAYGGAYASGERTARLERRGLWSSEFLPPSEWRRKNADR